MVACMALVPLGIAEQRHALLCASVFGVGLDVVVCRELGLGDRLPVEPVRWMDKCDYVVQLSVGASSRVDNNGRWTVPGFGT